MAYPFPDASDGLAMKAEPKAAVDGSQLPSAYSLRNRLGPSTPGSRWACGPGRSRPRVRSSSMRTPWSGRVHVLHPVTAGALRYVRGSDVSETLNVFDRAQTSRTGTRRAVCSSRVHGPG